MMKDILCVCFVSACCFLFQQQLNADSITLLFSNLSIGNVHVQTTGDYCISSVSPEDFQLSINEKRLVTINYESGVFTYCGWRHSHQYFAISLIYSGLFTPMAQVQWYKEAGGSDTINITSDDNNIIRVYYGNPIEVEISGSDES